MANPTGYERSYSFTGYQTTHQETPIPGPELDNEFENIERAIGQTQDALDDIRRSDGQLQNGIVTPDSLSPLLNIGFTNRGQWAPGVSYNAGDGVIHGEFFYSARVSHLSTNENAPDIDPQTWLYLFTFSGTITSEGGGARVHTGDDPPALPWHDGDLWWESDSGKLFVFYEDGDSGQWVETSPGGSGGMQPPVVADTMLVDNHAGTTRENKTFAEVREILDASNGPLGKIQINPVLADYENHVGFNPCLFPRLDGGLTFLTRRAPIHGSTDDAELIAWESYDCGLTNINMRTAYVGSTTDDRNLAFAPMNDRFGVMAGRMSGGSWIPPMFLYSDDQGLTWVNLALTLDAGLPPTYAASPHGPILRWPLSAGGHDSLGWIAYFYGSDIIAYATTIDNGTTWSTVRQAFAASMTANEMAVARVGVENKWVMVVRGADNAVVSTSTNMTTWTAASISAITLESNPPYFVQDDGSSTAWLYAPSRKGSGVIAGIGLNTVVACKVDVAALYNSNGASGFTAWSTVAQLAQWGVGYMGFVKYNGRWIAGINGGELTTSNSNNGFGANALYLLSSIPAAQGLSMLRGTAQHYAVNLNPYLQIWQNGTSGTGTAARMMTADGYGLRRTGSVTGHQWSRQVGNGNQYTLRCQRTPGNTATNALNVINVINENDVRVLRGKHCSISVRTKVGADFSSAGGILQIDVFGHVTDSQITSTDGTVPGSQSLCNATLAVDALGRWTDYDEPFLVTSDLSMVWVRMSYTAAGTAGANDYFDIAECRIVPTPYKQPRNMRPHLEELACCQRYFRKTYSQDVAPGTVIQSGALLDRARGVESVSSVTMIWRFPDMRAVPTVTVYSPTTGAAGQMYNVTGTVDVAGIGDNPATGGVVIVNNAATVTGSAYRAHAVASALPW